MSGGGGGCEGGGSRYGALAPLRWLAPPTSSSRPTRRAGLPLPAGKVAGVVRRRRRGGRRPALQGRARPQDAGHPMLREGSCDRANAPRAPAAKAVPGPRGAPAAGSTACWLAARSAHAHACDVHGPHLPATTRPPSGKKRGWPHAGERMQRRGAGMPARRKNAQTHAARVERRDARRQGMGACGRSRPVIRAAAAGKALQRAVGASWQKGAEGRQNGGQGREGPWGPRRPRDAPSCALPLQVIRQAASRQGACQQRPTPRLSRQKRAPQGAAAGLRGLRREWHLPKMKAPRGRPATVLDPPMRKRYRQAIAQTGIKAASGSRGAPRQNVDRGVSPPLERCRRHLTPHAAAASPCSEARALRGAEHGPAAPAPGEMQGRAPHAPCTECQKRVFRLFFLSKLAGRPRAPGRGAPAPVRPRVAARTRVSAAAAVGAAGQGAGDRGALGRPARWGVGQGTNVQCKPCARSGGKRRAGAGNGTCGVQPPLAFHNHATPLTPLFAPPCVRATPASAPPRALTSTERDGGGGGGGKGASNISVSTTSAST